MEFLESTPREEDPPLDDFCRNELFDVLGNKRRRYILCALSMRGGSMSCRELAKQVAAWETESTPERIASSQYQSVYNSFYQTHFPKLEDAGLIQYDRPAAIVHPTDRIDDLEPLFQPETVQTRRRQDLLKAALIGGGLIGGIIGSIAVGSIPGVVTIAAIAVFSVVAMGVAFQ